MLFHVPTRELMKLIWPRLSERLNVSSSCLSYHMKSDHSCPFCDIKEMFKDIYSYECIFETEKESKRIIKNNTSYIFSMFLCFHVFPVNF